MGFATDLQGRASHEALLKVQDAEIRLLEIIKRFITAHIEADRHYAASLTKMIAQATKGDNTDLLEFMDCCSVFRAWDTIITATEGFVTQLCTNADALSTRTLDSLNFLITEKKNSRQNYLEERNKLDSQVAKHQENVQKNKTEYARLLDRFTVDVAKYNDAQLKSKGGSKLEDAKAKYVRSKSRLHQQHNDYILGVQEANSYNTVYFRYLLPTTLDCHQCVQEIYIEYAKFILEDLCTQIDFSREPFQDIFSRMLDQVTKIDPGREYGSTFIEKYRSEPDAPVQFEFDSKLMNDYSCSLQSFELKVDDLTFENLQQRQTSCENQLKLEKKALEQLVSDLQAATVAAQKSIEKVKLEETAETMKDMIQKCQKKEIRGKEVVEKKVCIRQLKELLKTIQEPLNSLRDAAPPSALDESKVVERSDSLSNLSTSSKEKEKKINLKMPSFSLFKKGDKSNDKMSNDKIKCSQDDLEEEEYEVRPKAPNGSNRSGSYEMSQPGPVNGPSRMSMIAMREEGQILTSQTPVSSGRIEDEEWFHGVLPREEVQRLLTEDGDYLVRESKSRKTNESQYVLSVYSNGHKHFIIQGSEETGWYFEGPSYSTVHELIQQQHASGQYVTQKSQVILKKAIVREDWELLNDHIHLEMKIGSGNFGEVYKGKYVPKNIEVAVKTCRETLSEDQRKKFLLEGRILKQYDHPNIVKFIGIAAQRQPVMIVMEFVPGGSLLQFLRKQGKQQSKQQLTQMCADAANGMVFLEGRGCIHRDLAARNCLVGDKNVIKISDFGMSREEKEYTASEKMKQIPIKWTAPEALNFGKYTSLSDVWSYGILMWEIFSGGQQPYPGMTNAEARENVEEGYRMPQPSQMPDVVYYLMQRCWEYTPEKRPHFEEIYDLLKEAITLV